MGNGRKKDTALWMVFVQGVALSLGVYLLVTVLASLLLVKAVLPEAGAFPVLAAGCCLSAWGLPQTRRRVHLWRHHLDGFRRGLRGWLRRRVSLR